jgi:hypothetical protein
VAASTLADIAKHTPELAQVVADAGGLTNLVPMVGSTDVKLKMQVFFLGFMDFVLFYSFSRFAHVWHKSRNTLWI